MTTHRPRKKKKMTKESEFNNGDLISKLPDPLLHHIFSFLDMKFVIQTCVLSTRWRDLWISQPIMNFDEEFFDSDNHPSYKFFTTFVEKALFLHSTSEIHTFRLRCKDKYQGSIVPLDVWMPILNRRKVEVLDLQIQMTENHSIFRLPESFFKCRSLTTLKFDFGPMNDHGFIKIVEDEGYDIKSSLSNLKILHLSSIWILGGISDLISMCRNLETLVISKCSIELSELEIHHGELKHLVLENKLERPCRITVVAPRLTSFSCRDYPINDYSFPQFISFRDYQNDYAFGSTSFQLEADIDTDYYLTNSEFKWSDSVSMGKCLVQLHRVSSLTLSAWLLQLAFAFPNNGFELPRDQFRNLKFLKLKTSLSISQIRATVSLLKKCPQLETLVLQMTEPPLHERVGEEEEKWKAKLTPKCVMHQLKSVEILGAHSSVNELEFLKYMLNNAAILEKLVVNTPQDQLSNNAGKLRRFYEMLRSFEGTSADVRISFMF